MTLSYLPTDYCVIDTETSGFGNFSDIIEIAALRVRGLQVVDSFSSLVHLNRHLKPEIVHKTGITDEMLSGAPEISDVLPAFFDFVGDDPIVGHNVSFDVRFLNNYLSVEYAPEEIDTMFLARRLFPEMEHYRLEDVAARCSVPYVGAHRSLADCKITNDCYLYMRPLTPPERDMPQKKHTGKIVISDIVPRRTDFAEEKPVFGKTFVFSGNLLLYKRKEAMQQVVDRGGSVSNTVTKKTNYLVVGSFNDFQGVTDGKSNKVTAAEDLIAEGFDLKIIDEAEFAMMLRA